jgi:hypothetical protein
MADLSDVRGLRISRTELTKRGIDITRADLRMSHGVLYVKGAISVLKGAAIKDLKAEVEHIRLLLRQKPDIRDVIVDVQYLA